MAIGDRVRSAWNAFFSRDPTAHDRDYGLSTYYRPDRPRMSRGNERSILTSVLNRIALDVAAVKIRHVRLDEDNRYLEDIDSDLNECYTVSANLDQTPRAFIQDACLTMFNEGHVVLVPVDTTDDPTRTNSFDVQSVRTATVVKWMPEHVRVSCYNERIGRREEVTLPKRMVSIIENPFYVVMNEQNSTVQRLIRKLNLLDVIDEQSSSGKLDLIIQLPYIIKTEARREQAEQRRKDIERQLAGSKYGIAYTDGTERITQLNRAVENNFMHEIEFLFDLFYSQLGITKEIMNGTADEKVMLNYENRTVEPIVDALVSEMKRKWLTKTARTQKQSIMYFVDQFKFVPMADLAELSDKLTRNEIASSNEMRQVMGMKPSKDPDADELRNKNISESKEELQAKYGNIKKKDVSSDQEGESQNE